MLSVFLAILLNRFNRRICSDVHYKVFFGREDPILETIHSEDFQGKKHKKSIGWIEKLVSCSGVPVRDEGKAQEKRGDSIRYARGVAVKSI
jgi:hypothetical protein